MKVAVIDDDPTVLDLMQGILQDMGNEAATRASAVGASAWILRERPDIVLVDLDEGVRLASQLVGCEPDDIEIGQRVVAKIVEVQDGLALPLFEIDQ